LEQVALAHKADRRLLLAQPAALLLLEAVRNKDRRRLQVVKSKQVLPLAAVARSKEWRHLEEGKSKVRRHLVEATTSLAHHLVAEIRNKVLLHSEEAVANNQVPHSAVAETSNRAHHLEESQIIDPVLRSAEVATSSRVRRLTGAEIISRVRRLDVKPSLKMPTPRLVNQQVPQCVPMASRLRLASAVLPPPAHLQMQTRRRKEVSTCLVASVVARTRTKKIPANKDSHHSVMRRVHSKTVTLLVVNRCLHRLEASLEAARCPPRHSGVARRAANSLPRHSEVARQVASSHPRHSEVAGLEAANNSLRQ
jgi:hypothetical protein